MMAYSMVANCPAGNNPFSRPFTAAHGGKPDTGGLGRWREFLNQGVQAERVQGRRDPVSRKIRHIHAEAVVVESHDIPDITTKFGGGLEMAADSHPMAVGQGLNVRRLWQKGLLHGTGAGEFLRHTFAIGPQVMNQKPFFQVNAHPRHQFHRHHRL